MHITYHGGSALARRWFDEALRSMAGEFLMVEYVATGINDWFPRVTHSPIEYAPVFVDVFWDSDPDPNVHNEWAYTFSQQRLYGPDDIVTGLGVLEGPYNFDQFGNREPVPNDELIWSHADIRIKPNLTEKGEALYKDVVRHELAHALSFASFNDGDKLNMSNLFGEGQSSPAAADDWWDGADVSWSSRGKEMWAEAFKDIMFVPGGIGGPRFSFSRAKRTIAQSGLTQFAASGAPSRFFVGVVPDDHPWAEAIDAVPHFEDPGEWAVELALPTPQVGESSAVLWIHTYSTGDVLSDSSSPEIFDPGPEYLYTTVYSTSYNLSGFEEYEINVAHGREMTLDVRWGGLSSAFIVNNHFLSDFENGLPEYTRSPGSLSVAVRDAEGRPCWMPDVFTYGPDPGPPPIASTHLLSATQDGDLMGFWQELEISGPFIGPFGWLHDPDEELVPMDLGIKAGGAHAGERVWYWRPRATFLKLPLQITLQGSAGGLDGGPLPQPGPPVPELRFSHRPIPTYLPPWPYGGSIEAIPAPPGTRPRKPSMGAPGPAITVAP